MKVRSLLILGALFCFGGSAMAADCEATVESNDAMQFIQKEITVSKSCETFTVKLAHIGVLPKTVMGHNLVITKADDINPVATEGMTAGVENSYVKAGDTRVIAKSDVIGGGETTSVTFNVKDFQDGVTYGYFCSFPGHFAVMRGTFIVK